MPDASTLCNGKFSPLRQALVGVKLSDIADARWEDAREMVPASLRVLFAILYRDILDESLKSTNIIGNVLNLSRQVHSRLLS